MKSPFPGMDPYLERHWLDVHASLVSGARDALNRILPDDLVASIEERIAIESDELPQREYVPDVQVFQPNGAGMPGDSSAAAADAPLRLVAVVEPITERFIHIIETASQRLITVIEFVSPTNKRGQGLHAFRAKRTELLAAGVNFVEIDLVRDGDWQALLRPHVCPRPRFSPYRATLRIPTDPGAVYLHPVSLQSPIPAISIPLRPPDPPVRLDIQSLVEQTYTNGRYSQRLNYAQPPDPELSGDDAMWAKQMLTHSGR